MIQMLAGLLLLLTLCLILCVVFLIQRQKRGYQRPPVQLRFGQSSQPHKSPSPVPKKTQKKLMSLVHGNRSTAERLLSKVRQINPNRSEIWIWEKAIFDLERDRR
jgi:hypothetical protein